MVVEAGDDGREHEADGDACGGEFLDGGEAARGRARSRFEDFGEVAVESGDGDAHSGGVVFGEFAEVVGVASDEVVFGDDADGVAELGEDGEAGAGDF